MVVVSVTMPRTTTSTLLYKHSPTYPEKAMVSDEFTDHH